MISPCAKALTAALIIFSSCIAPAATSKHSHKSHPASTTIFDKTFCSNRLTPHEPDHIYADYRRVSPDGKYVARVTLGDGEVGYATVYRNTAGAHPWAHAKKVSREFDDIRNCAWLPGRPHSFVVATGGADYGAGYLALWTGKGQTRFLQRARVEDGEGYSIQSISSNGHTLVYQHSGSDQHDVEFQRTHSLNIPR
ncbi:MAG: hypothetical protein JWQ02_474 [Capsulimonas sp.]|jgi:hypothetical protein|nr:hypothetical protein [Capsulimonas sp.]